MRPQVQPIESAKNDPEAPIAKKEIGNAWSQYRQSAIKCFKDGIEFGRVCHQWQTRYRAQGSRHGKGFERVLSELNIPKSTAYRWITRYEIKKGLRPARHEVRQSAEKRAIGEPSVPMGVATGVAPFVLMINEQEEQQLREDIKALGGEEKVTKMIIKFVSEKAAETRIGALDPARIRSVRADRVQAIALGA